MCLFDKLFEKKRFPSEGKNEWTDGVGNDEKKTVPQI